MKKYDVAIVGATGLVGRTFLQVLDERNFPIQNQYLYSSARSAGNIITFRGNDYKVIELTNETIRKCDFALFSAGGDISKQYAPVFAKNGTVVIDNSSAWRMHVDVPLVVPEVNSHHIANHKGIIANPNCSTIQLMPVLDAINKSAGLEKVIVSTYQSISGAGQKGLSQLQEESKGHIAVEPTKQIYSNAIFHPASESNPEWTVEEIKMVNESRKILSIPDLKFSVTCVRLPIEIGHSESVYVETKENFELDNVISAIETMPNIILMNNFSEGEYPTPVISQDRDEIFVGRIRHDINTKNGLWFWVVANNVRKGAATNAVQIAEEMIK